MMIERLNGTFFSIAMLGTREFVSGSADLGLELGECIRHGVFLVADLSQDASATASAAPCGASATSSTSAASSSAATATTRESLRNGGVAILRRC
jgi:hypothetical protein